MTLVVRMLTTWDVTTSSVTKNRHSDDGNNFMKQTIGWPFEPVLMFISIIGAYHSGSLTLL
jgi:hypothetical protein